MGGRTSEKKPESAVPPVPRPARVLLAGESMLLSQKTTELEFVLYRPLHPACPLPLSVTAGPGRTQPSSPLTARRDETFEGDPLAVSVSTSQRVVVTSPRHSLRRRSANRPRSSRAKKASADADAAAAAATAIPRPPLFFDTAACLFQDSMNRTDYVATGRHATDEKGLFRMPHAVVTGTEAIMVPTNYCNYNVGNLSAGYDDASLYMLSTRTTNSGHNSLTNISDGMASEWAQAHLPQQQKEVFVPPDGAVTMAAGDGVLVNFKRVSTCTGALISTTLFSNDVSLCSESNLFYMVRKSNSTRPVCLVPISVPDSSCPGSIVMMLRRVKVKKNTTWELANVSEPLTKKDVKEVVLTLQSRGLRDPVGYQRDGNIVVIGEVSSSEELSNSSSSMESRSMSCSSDSAAEIVSGSASFHSSVHSTAGEEGEGKEAVLQVSQAADGAAPTTVQRKSKLKPAAEAPSRHHHKLPFEDLLAGVDPVVREGRRQYNVGRSHVHPMLSEGVSSDEDEVLDDALRVAVPQYVSNNVVRYEDGTYNVGSRSRVMASHYVERREAYALDEAGNPLRATHTHASGAGTAFSPNAAASRGALGRRLTDCSDGGVVNQRPEPPLELLPDDVIAARLAGAAGRLNRSSSNGSRRRSSVRRRRSSRRRGGSSRARSKHSSRAGSRGRNKKKKSRSRGKGRRSKRSSSRRISSKRQSSPKRLRVRPRPPLSRVANPFDI